MVEVSIIILNYNTYDMTCECIEKVMLHTKNVKSYEVIIVDNASKECSALLFKDRYPDIKLVSLQDNVGFSRGNNEGIKVAQGNKLLLLNSDAFLLNDAISICAKALDENSDVGVVSCKLENEDGSPQYSCQRFPAVKVLLFELFRLQKFLSNRYSQGVLLGSFFTYDRNTFVDWTWGTFFMLKKELLNEFPDHKLHDDFFMYGEDLYWCKYISNLGKKILFVSEGRIRHLMGASSGPKSQMMLENEKVFMRDFYSGLSRFFIKIVSRVLNFTVK